MNFSVEEENLICMYHTSDRRRTMARNRRICTGTCAMRSGRRTAKNSASATNRTPWRGSTSLRWRRSRAKNPCCGWRASGGRDFRASARRRNEAVGDGNTGRARREGGQFLIFLPSASLGHLAGSWSIFILPFRLALFVEYRRIRKGQIEGRKYTVKTHPCGRPCIRNATVRLLPPPFASSAFPPIGGGRSARRSARP